MPAVYIKRVMRGPTGGEEARCVPLNPSSMRPRKRDPAFLRLAVLAAVGGVSAIVFAIGLPLWERAHGHAVTPAFSLFAAWGVAALGGAFACLHTYFISDPGPERPPHGGVPLAVLEGGVPAPVSVPATPRSQRRAA